MSFESFGDGRSRSTGRITAQAHWDALEKSLEVNIPRISGFWSVNWVMGDKTDEEVTGHLIGRVTPDPVAGTIVDIGFIFA